MATNNTIYIYTFGAGFYIPKLDSTSALHCYQASFLGVNGIVHFAYKTVEHESCCLLDDSHPRKEVTFHVINGQPAGSF